MAKLKREKRIDSFEEIFQELLPLYQEKKTKYAEVWVKKYRTMVILWFVLILPGLIYWAFVWNSTAAKRDRKLMANQFIDLAFRHMSEHSTDGWIKEFSINFNYQPLVKKSLPISSGDKIWTAFRSGLGSLVGNSLIRTLQDSLFTTKRQNTLFDVLYAANLLPFVSTQGDFGRNLAFNLVGGTGGLVSRTMHLEHTAVVSFKINDMPFSLYNLRVKVVEVRKQRVKTKNGTTTILVPTTINTFNGAFMSTPGQLNYPEQLNMMDKKIGLAYDGYLAQVQMAKIKYDMSAPGFDERYVIRTTKELGPELRVLFQPRITYELGELAVYAPQMVLESIPGRGSFGLFKQLANTHADMAFDIHNPHKFMTKVDVAKKMLDKELSFLLGICKTIAAFDDESFVLVKD